MATTTRTQTSASPRPTLSLKDAVRLARDLYGLRAEARELPSERDQNFHLQDAAGQEFVLKISGTAEQEAVLDFQNKAIAHLMTVGEELPCARVWTTTAGESIARVAGVNGATHFVRLLTYVPGKPLALVKPHSP